MSKDNVWAFPRGQSDYSENRGMTLRDYMAIHASEEDIARVLEYNMTTRQQARYMHADAMLAERAK
jgi:hypothetical protein